MKKTILIICLVIAIVAIIGVTCVILKRNNNNLNNQSGDTSGDNYISGEVDISEEIIPMREDILAQDINISDEGVLTGRDVFGSTTYDSVTNADGVLEEEGIGYEVVDENMRYMETKKKGQLALKNNTENEEETLNNMVNFGIISEEQLADILDSSDDVYDDSLFTRIYSSDKTVAFNYKFNTTAETVKTAFSEAINAGKEEQIKEILDICLDNYYFNEAERDYLLGITDEI